MTESFDPPATPAEAFRPRDVVEITNKRGLTIRVFGVRNLQDITGRRD